MNGTPPVMLARSCSMETHGLYRIPLVQEHKLAAACERAHQGRRKGSGMEERHREQDDAWAWLGQTLAAPPRRLCGAPSAGHDVGQQVAVGPERALGLAGGATGMKMPAGSSLAMAASGRPASGSAGQLAGTPIRSSSRSAPSARSA